MSIWDVARAIGHAMKNSRNAPDGPVFKAGAGPIDLQSEAFFPVDRVFMKS